MCTFLMENIPLSNAPQIIFNDNTRGAIDNHNTGMIGHREWQQTSWKDHH